MCVEKKRGAISGLAVVVCSTRDSSIEGRSSGLCGKDEGAISSLAVGSDMGQVGWRILGFECYLNCILWP